MSHEKKTETGGSAFPEVFTDYRADRNTSDFYPEVYSAGGMTLRDYFAAKAMVGLLGRPSVSWNSLGTEAYKLADAMILVRGAA